MSLFTRRHLAVILAVATFAAQPSAPVYAATLTLPEDAGITRLREALIAAFNKGDIDGVLAHVTPDVIVTWQNGTTCHGSGELRAFYTRMMNGDHPVVAKITSDPQVDGRLLHGDWAVSFGHMNDRFTLTDGSDLPFDSRFTAVLVRQTGEWRVNAFHVSANAFDNPTVSYAAKKGATYGALAGGAGGLVVGVIAGVAIARRRRATVA